MKFNHGSAVATLYIGNAQVKNGGLYIGYRKHEHET